MKREFAATALFACALFTTACSQAPVTASAPPDTREADAKALRDLEEGWQKDMDAKDLEKTVAHYTDDAMLMAPGMTAASGKDAIRKTWQEMSADAALSLKFHTSKAEVAKSGDVGYTRGTYTLVMTDPVTKKIIHDSGNYVTVYNKQADGSWKAVEDIASSEGAPMPAKK